MKSSKLLVCVDASLIVPTLVPHPLSEQAETLLAGWRSESRGMIAPALLAFEVTATVRGYVYAKVISPERGEQAIAEFLQLPIRHSSQRSLFPLANRLAHEFNRPRAYDTAYLALAQLRRCEFWTADERLYNAVKDRFPWVRWVGNAKEPQTAQ